MNKYKGRIACFYVLMVFLVIPSYHRGTFSSISQRKVEIFYAISGVTLALYFVTSLYYDMKGIAPTEKKRLVRNPMEWAMVFFLASVGLAALLSSYKSDVIYGIPGFGMGLLSLAIMVFSYFLISRELVCTRRLFHGITLTSLPPVLLALLNHLGYDPLKFYTADELSRNRLYYISTIGNYGWFSEYLAVIIPVVIWMLRSETNRVRRFLYAIYALILGSAALISGTKMLYLTTGAVAVILLARPVWQKTMERRWSIALLLAAAVVLYAGIVVVASGSEGAANGRGYIWRLTFSMMKTFSSRDLIFGVGPNCYWRALQEYLEHDATAATVFTEHFRNLALTSAHSDYIDYLVNQGIAGLASYMAIVYLALKRFVHSGQKTCQEIAGLCVISYLLYTTLNFSIVCATPLFFALAGIAIADGASL